MSARVLAVAFGPNLAVPLFRAEYVGCLAFPTKVPALVAVRALVSGSLATGAAIFRGASGQVADS